MKRLKKTARSLASLGMTMAFNLFNPFNPLNLVYSSLLIKREKNNITRMEPAIAVVNGKSLSGDHYFQRIM